MLQRIKTQEEVSRKQKRNQFIVGAILILLMVVSTAGFALMSSDEEDSKVEEAGLDFYRQGSLWRISFDGAVFGFQYLPSEVSNISVEGIYTLGDYINQPLYFVNINEGVPEVLSNLEQYILRYQEACLNNSTCEGDLPTKSCEDNLIIFENSEETRVYQEGKCVYITGDPVMGADAFLYEVLKIK